MASSYPSTQSEMGFAALTENPGHEQHPYPFADLLGDAQPPSPNGMSAAAILASLSDSRPSTSHADFVGLQEEEDTEGGGVALDDHWDAMDATLSMLEHTPLGYIDLSQTWNTTIAAVPSSALEDHTAAFEALSMESFQPSSLPSMPNFPATLLSLQVNSTHQEFDTSVYENYYLGALDKSAFNDITNFYHYYAVPPASLVKPLDPQQPPPEVVKRDDLQGDRCDFQGIDWSERLGRQTIRMKRDLFESARLAQRDLRKDLPRGLVWRYQCNRLPKTESFFSFCRMNTKHRACYPHFQLRNLMTVTSRNSIYYATREGVVRTDASGSSPVPVMDLRKQIESGTPCQITTLAASGNVMVAGGFEGEYCVADLASSEAVKSITGSIRDPSVEKASYITNHVHLFNSRSSYTPQGVLCSNDGGLRILDCETSIFRSHFAYSTAVNCSATSPDGRLRVVVGDFHETLITDAETGKPLQSLNIHEGDAFACAWADDGIHVASAAQDSTIAVWDARYWARPVAMIASELSIPRVLAFSPVGSGPRVLVTAEADDFVNIINAQTFESRQVFDFFGPNAGISMTPDGQSLFVANADKCFGGIIELERTGWGETVGPTPSHGPIAEEERADWNSDDELDRDRRVVCHFGQRNRRGLDLGALCV